MNGLVDMAVRARFTLSVVFAGSESDFEEDMRRMNLVHLTIAGPTEINSVTGQALVTLVQNSVVAS
jgi:hypothetical protein